ncbi:MAG: hypothetical protein Q8N08_03750 [Methanobacteriaceae archaeon]|nr:hypothetical protein [Methanobacteriaceae archaeon]
MQIFNSSNERKNFLWLILKIILALALIKLFREAIIGVLWFIIHPGNNITLFQTLNGLSFLLVGLILLLYFRPSLKELGLNWDDIRLKTRIIYLFGILFLVFLALTLTLSAGK